MRRTHLEAALGWILRNLEGDLDGKVSRCARMKYDLGGIVCMPRLVARKMAARPGYHTFARSERLKRWAKRDRLERRTWILHVSPGFKDPRSGKTVKASVGFGAPPSTSSACEKLQVAGISLQFVSCIEMVRQWPQNTEPNLRFSMLICTSGSVTLARITTLTC